MLARVCRNQAQREMNGTRNIMIFLFVFVLRIGGMSAQTYSGVVRSENGAVLSSVSVMLKNEKGSIVSFTATNSKGFFSLKNDEGRQAALIEFRHMGFATVSMPVGKFRNGQPVVMKEATYTLKEVKVKPQKIRQSGDTLNYLVGSFRREQDRSIADVIARMPGLEVGTDGRIMYQGKGINRFYIEGLDLMGGKYAVASGNIDAGKVKKVQVLENHQPVKMLKDVKFSDQAALNIVLEDDVKDTWQGEAALSAGTSMQGKTDFLYDSRLLAMLFSRKKQSISMYKCDNTGKDISGELKSLASLEDFVPTETGLLSGIALGGTGLSKRRSMFNDTHIWATNWLFRTSHDNDFRLQLTALFDKCLQREDAHTIYTDVAGNALITEYSDARSYRNEYEGELTYKVNKDNIYLMNKMNGYADFNRSLGLTLLNDRKTCRGVRPRKRYLTDNLKLIKNLKNKRSFTLNTSLSYNNLPGTLLLSDGTEETLYISSFYWNTYTEFRHRLGPLFVNYTAGINLKRQDMDVENYLDKAHDKYDEQMFYVSPSLSYSGGCVNFDVRVPLNWRHRKLNGYGQTCLRVEPGALFRYEPFAKIQLFVNYACSWNPRDALSSGSSAVFTDYITVRQGSGQLENTMSHMAGLSVKYKDVINGFFANGGMSYLNMRGDMMYKGELKDNIYYSTPAYRQTNTNFFSVRASVSKSFDLADMFVRLSANRSWRNYNLLVSDDIIPFRTEASEVKVDFSVRPAGWLSADLSSSFNHSRQVNRADKSMSGEPLRYFVHSLKTCIMPGKWLVEWGNELYHSNDNTVSSTFFSDLSVSYKTKNIEAGLAINNIFGKQTFERRYITDTRRLYTVSRLRPRELLVKLRFGF